MNITFFKLKDIEGADVLLNADKVCALHKDPTTQKTLAHVEGFEVPIELEMDYDKLVAILNDKGLLIELLGMDKIQVGSGDSNRGLNGAFPRPETT